MNQLKAMQDTLALAAERGYSNLGMDEPGLDFDHLSSMVARAESGYDVTGSFSEAKLGRWLGYMQGVLVCNAVMTLEEAKQINMKNKD